MADFINNIFGIGDSWVGYLIAALIAAVLILHVVAVGALHVQTAGAFEA